jgi:microcystin-dependent protein
MAWPGASISTANLDSGTDSPASARADLLAAVQAINDIIGSRAVASGIASTDAAGLVPTGQGGMPSGAMVDFAGATAPTGWLLCDGAAVSRTTYAGLFTAIGTAYGAGDGSTTFNVPDLRGRIGVGKDDMGGTNAQRMTVVQNGTTTNASANITGLSSTANLAIGMKVFGTGIPAGATVATITSATAITISANATASGTVSLRFGVVDGITLGDAGGDDVHTLVTAQMPAHTHTIQAQTASSVNAGGFNTVMNTGGGTNTSNSTGGGQAHPNVQPSVIVNKIIKT